MKSELIRSVFLDELDRNNRLILRYEKELSALPKGSLLRRKIGNQLYDSLSKKQLTVLKQVCNENKITVFETFGK